MRRRTTTGSDERNRSQGPDIGDFTDVPVIEVLVKPGDTVKAEDSLVTLESDKATMDVPSPARAPCKELKVKLGDKVSEGSVVLMLDGAAAPRSARDGASAAPLRAASTSAARRAAAPTAPAQARPRAAGGPTIEVRVPDIGDFNDVPVIEVFVKPGDTVKAERPAGHARIRQGDDGRAVAARRRRRRRAASRSATRCSEGTPIAVAEDRADGAEPASRATPPSHPADTDARDAGDAARRRGSGRQPPPRPRPRRRRSGSRRTRQSALALRACVAVGAQVRARARRRLSRRSRAAGRRAASSQDDVQAFVKGALAGAPRPRARRRAPRGGGALEPAAVAAGRLREVRPDRDASRCRASRRSPARTSRATG